MPVRDRASSICIRFFVSPAFIFPKCTSHFRRCVKPEATHEAEVLCVGSIRIPTASNVNNIQMTKVCECLLSKGQTHGVFTTAENCKMITLSFAIYLEDNIVM